MPAEAGIQFVGYNNEFKDLDSRFRGNDSVFSIATQSPRGEGGCGWSLIKIADFLIFFTAFPKYLKFFRTFPKE